VPERSVATMLMTHTLVGVALGFGIGSGGPYRHPAEVHFRLPHVPVPTPVQHVLGVPDPVQKPLSSAPVSVVGPRVSDVPLHMVTLAT